MDMGPAFAKASTENAPCIRICPDPFHVVKPGTEALEDVKKDLWRQIGITEESRRPDRTPDPDTRRYQAHQWSALPGI